MARMTFGLFRLVLLASLVFLSTNLSAQTLPTGIGHGVALPHARLEALTEPVVVIGVSDAGVDFDAPDGEPAHVIFLILTPQRDAGAQLEISADVGRLFSRPDMLERVLRTRSYAEFLGNHDVDPERRGQLLVRAVQLDPQQPAFRVALAEFHAEREEWRQAMEQMQAAVSYGPDVPQYAEKVNEYRIKDQQTQNRPQP